MGPEPTCDTNEPLNKLTEHLLTVHLAIVTVCFGLLVGSYLTEASDAQRAKEQFQSIKDIHPRWHKDWHEARAKELVEKIPDESVRTVWIADASNSHPAFSLQTGTPWVIGVPWVMPSAAGSSTRYSPWTEVEGSRAGDLPRLEAKPPERLSDFKLLWNTLATQSIQVYVAESVGKRALLWKPKYAPAPLNSMSGERGQTFPPDQFEVVAISKSQADRDTKPPAEVLPLGLTYVSKEFSAWVKRDPRTAALLDGLNPIDDYYYTFFGGPPNGDEVLALPAKVTEIDFNAQVAFVDVHHLAFHLGQFHDVFPELDRLTENLQDLPDDKLQAILESESRRSSEQVEILGAKLPTEALAIWGPIILVTMQCYFLLHLFKLKTLAYTSGKASCVPWIGIYPTSAARIATLLFASALPVTVVIVLAIRHRPRSWLSVAIFGDGLAIFASLLLAILCARTLRLTWQASHQAGFIPKAGELHEAANVPSTAQVPPKDVRDINVKPDSG